MPPSLSVIIPTFNRADYLRECLRSLGASGVGDLEIIVVDDGSTEDIPAVVNAAGVRARCITQRNQGPAAARNNGFCHSTGRYVCFLDCDDEWLPGVAPRLIDALERHPDIYVLFADAHLGNRRDGFRSWIEVAGQAKFEQLPGRDADASVRVFDREPLLQRMLVRNCVFLGSTIIRREVFERFGPFDPTLCGAADWNLWLRLASQTTFAFHREALAIYTQHPAGMSNDTDGMYREFCMALKRLQGQAVLTAPAESIRQRQLRHHLFGYAYRAYDRGDYREARRRFRDLLRTTGWEARGLAYWLLSCLPRGLAGRLRRVKHWWSGREHIPVVEAVPAARAVLEPR